MIYLTKLMKEDHLMTRMHACKRCGAPTHWSRPKCIECREFEMKYRKFKEEKYRKLKEENRKKNAADSDYRILERLRKP